MREWVVSLAWALGLAFLLRATVVDARVIPTPSMIPTIRVGERVIEDKVFFRLAGIHRGDIVVFTPPFPAPEEYIKRVIGLPGETVEVRGGRVLVDGRPLTEPYINAPPLYQFGPVEVPDGHVLVLGDNRNDSNDSHAWGTLEIAAIAGRAVWRYWPPGRFGSLLTDAAPGPGVPLSR